MASYGSLLLYIITFIFGFWLDSPAYRNNHNLRSVYVVWLYVFLCFGYMTGADWRNYEVVFYDWNDVMDKDYGYVYTTNFLHHIIGDFWVIFDGFRCLYLWSVIVLMKKFTPFWLSAISFMMPMSLLSLTVDSPFRFMIALMFLNFAIINLLKHRYVLVILFCIVAATFHASTIVVIPFLLLLNTGLFVKTKNWILVLVYLAIIVFTANLNNINYLQDIIGLAFSDFGLNSYKSYEAEISVGVFNLGFIIQSMLFLFVICTKSLIAQSTPNGTIVANMSILFFYIQRLGFAIPTGHRFCWLFTLFVAVYFANLFHIKYFKECFNTKVINSTIVRNVGIVFIMFIVYYGGSMTKTILNHFAYIPYTNSIPYVITGHKPFSEREKYNLIAYKQRTGKSFVLNSDK